MTVALTLSSDARTTAGILLLTVLAVEYGGLVMLRIVRGHQPATDFPKSFARAGHAHAGVFVVFALVAQILADAADLNGIANVLARDGIWAARSSSRPASSSPQPAAPPSPTSSSSSSMPAPSASRPACSRSASASSAHDRLRHCPERRRSGLGHLFEYTTTRSATTASAGSGWTGLSG
jgi:hypothetical protein